MKFPTRLKVVKPLIFAFLPLILFTVIALSKLTQNESRIKYTCDTNQGILLEATNQFITVKLANGEEIIYKEIVVQHSTDDFHYFEGVNRNANAQKVELSIKKKLPENTYEFTVVLGSEAYSGNAKIQRTNI